MSDVIHIVRYNGNMALVSNDPQELLDILGYEARINNVFQAKLERTLAAQRECVLNDKSNESVPTTNANLLGISLITTIPILRGIPFVYVVFSPTSTNPLLLSDPNDIGPIPEVRDKLERIADNIKSAIAQGQTPKGGSNVQRFDMPNGKKGTAFLTVIHAKAFGENTGTLRIDYDMMLGQYERNHE